MENLISDDLSLICSADGQCWWQMKAGAKTHMAALFQRVDPRSGDLLIDPDTEDMVAQAMEVIDGRIILGKRFIMDVPQRGRTAGKACRKPFNVLL